MVVYTLEPFMLEIISTCGVAGVAGIPCGLARICGGGYLAGLRGVLAGCLRIASNSGKRFPKAVGATWDSGSFAGIFINE